MQKPLGMRIYVEGVPLDASWFCPYCCATVDTTFVTQRGTLSRTRSEPMPTLTSNTLPGALAFLCDAHKPYPLGPGGA